MSMGSLGTRSHALFISECCRILKTHDILKLIILDYGLRGKNVRQINSSLAEKICFTDTEHTHAHNFGHLILPLQGTLFLRTRQQAMTINDQYLLLLPPGCEHTYYAKDRNEFLVFYIPWFMFSNNYNADEVNYLEMDARWRSLRFLMLSECQDKKADTAAINSAVVQDLVRYPDFLILCRDVLIGGRNQ